MIKAVIFDMDGVLIEFRELYFEIYNEFLKECGINEDMKKFSKILIGRSFKDKMAWMSEKFNKPIDVEKGIEFRESEIKKRIKNIELCEGSKELIEDIKKNRLKIGLATSNLRWFADKVLEETRIKEYFDFIITSESVKRSKPDPHIYFLAMEGLDVKPEETIIIEDAVNGIKAAHGAGAKCIAVTTKYLKREDLTEADLVIDSLEELSAEKIINF